MYFTFSPFTHIKVIDFIIKFHANAEHDNVTLFFHSQKIRNKIAAIKMAMDQQTHTQFELD